MANGKHQARSGEFRISTDGMTRRRFVQYLGGFAALGIIDPQLAALAATDDRRRLSWIANQTAADEGIWDLTDIEGKIPENLSGTLYRIAPGQSENHGVTLQHFFDGDAFTSAFSLRDGKATLRTRFVESPQRIEEIEAGRMLYNEFGTKAPESSGGAAGKSFTGKNQPSVNVIPWDGRLLGLSEGGHPTEIDPQTLAYRSRWDFHGTLPKMVPFTAHPKYDPDSGVGYGFGIGQGPGMPLMIYRMETDGRLTRLHMIPQQNYYMIHDMMMSKNHLIFAIPPVKFQMADMLSGRATIADAIRFFESEPLRFLIVRRDGTGEPVTIEQPGSLVFHNGNAYEEDGKLIVDSILTDDGSPLELLKCWASDKLAEAAPPKITRLVLNPETGEVESRTVIDSDLEFPRFDIRRSGENVRYLYAMEGALPEDKLAVTRLVRHDLHSGKAERIDAGRGRCLGETVFVGHPGTDAEDRGWLLGLGYDGERNETYLDIRDAGSLELEARLWTGTHFPLGFHGNFMPGWHVSPERSVAG